MQNTIRSTRSTSVLVRALDARCSSRSFFVHARLVSGVGHRPPVLPQSVIPPRATKAIDLSGPRFGLTMLSQGTVDALKDRDLVVRPRSAIRFSVRAAALHGPTGMSALTEFVPLISGLEQGVALPSLNWLVGIRGASGAEFGIGPNITPVGVGLVSGRGDDSIGRAQHPAQLRRGGVGSPARG